MGEAEGDPRQTHRRQVEVEAGGFSSHGTGAERVLQAPRGSSPCAHLDSTTMRA